MTTAEIIAKLGAQAEQLAALEPRLAAAEKAAAQLPAALAKAEAAEAKAAAAATRAESLAAALATAQSTAEQAKADAAGIEGKITASLGALGIRPAAAPAPAAAEHTGATKALTPGEAFIAARTAK